MEIEKKQYQDPLAEVECALRISITRCGKYDHFFWRGVEHWLESGRQGESRKVIHKQVAG
jgi:hypothetical protein